MKQKTQTAFLYSHLFIPSVNKKTTGIFQKSFVEQETNFQHDFFIQKS